ncbi:hypothetical protein CIL05_07215 [Virgibacillus profundi]|uniref:Integrase n=1 Tax=Virgibacillus profundi TaxID=2024555 RepID=A0A2A2IGI4_9BACI|nr:hypothetical protein [Virgibacillus profundi]PAV30250.1 hypothetical protein CIL05_07215 [Virgibacillus profundi]PXY54422.1 hypothetical protein CIT14_07300 [Virgibacillus profundi]
MELYNQSTKMEYLDTLASPDVQTLLRSVFEKSKNTEILYDKDLHSFSLGQIEEVIRNINPATLNSVSNTKSRINTYLIWAINNGRRENNINPLAGTTKEWERKFIDNVSQRYLSETDMFDLTEMLLNAQDQALIQCIFEGISGQAMSELISMNYHRINWNDNEVTVKDVKTNNFRTVKVSNRCIKFIENAYRQQVFTAEDTENEKQLAEFEGSVFKNTVWKNTRNHKVSRGNLAKRLYIIKDKYEMDSLTVNTISESGRIKMAADLYRERGKLGKQEFTEIGDRFNINKMTVNGYSYYDTAKMKNYIDSENLKEMYNLDVEF